MEAEGRKIIVHKDKSHTLDRLCYQGKLFYLLMIKNKMIYKDDIMVGDKNEN